MDFKFSEESAVSSLGLGSLGTIASEYGEDMSFPLDMEDNDSLDHLPAPTSVETETASVTTTNKPKDPFELNLDDDLSSVDMFDGSAAILEDIISIGDQKAEEKAVVIETAIETKFKNISNEILLEESDVMIKPEVPTIESLIPSKILSDPESTKKDQIPMEIQLDNNIVSECPLASEPIPETQNSKENLLETLKPSELQIVKENISETLEPVMKIKDFSFIKPKALTNNLSTKTNSKKTLDPVTCFEEETCGSWSLDNKGNKKEEPVDLVMTIERIEVEKTLVLETSIPITETWTGVAPDPIQLPSNKRKNPDEMLAILNPVVEAFQISKLFEYQWPPDKGDFCLLQEQITEFLEVKSFKRKHPELTRRNIDLDERVFLKERNVVSETQCDLGLTALKSEEVLELMMKDYPDKYQIYVQFLHEKERQAVAQKNKEYAAAIADKNKAQYILRKAIKSASEYNSHLNQVRKEERTTSFDLQTFTIHVPASKARKLNQHDTRVGKYPVSLLPGQFQDYYRTYTPTEMKYLPMNTVLYGPLQEMNLKCPQGTLSEGSQSDSDDSCASEISSGSSSQEGTQESGESSSSSDGGVNTTTNNSKLEQTLSVVLQKIGGTTQKICKVCHGPQDQNKQGRPEELIHCSECKTCGHPSCLELTGEIVQVIRSYNWQCMDCKSCMLCMDPYDEDKMMFCDKCDRGFHTFCVGLKTLPSGRWICQLCGQCSICGSNTPGPEGTRLQWQQVAGEGNRNPQLFCSACTKQKKK